jgi:methanogenic corrinoid protein MtbC1
MSKGEHWDGAEAEYAAYLAALLEGERRTCEAILRARLERDAEARTIYEDLVQRSLYEVGERWERGEVSVATEHLVTAITESLLSLLYPQLVRGPRNGRTAVVSSLANEHHQVGARIVADYFELHGWRSHFLGADTPVRDLLDLTATRRPDVVALSLALSTGLETLRQATAALRAAFPGLPILVGGQAFRRGGREQAEAIGGVRYLASLTDLEEWIRCFPSHAC